MSRCVKCMDYFHPDLCIETNIHGDNVIVCLFCYLDKKELTIEDKEGKIIEKVTKKEACIRYKRYLDDLMLNPNIAELVSGGKKDG